jgi:hypothetical protein
LVHYPVIWLTRDLLESNYPFVTTTLVSIALSMPLAFVQLKVDQQRYRFRGFTRFEIDKT